MARRDRVLALMVFSLGASLGVLASCGPAPAKCGPSNCTGCCTPAAQCSIGFSDTECGSGGATCRSCPLGQRCQAGLCVSVSTGGGGGGGSGGGGGGSAGGGAAGGAFGGATGGTGGVTPLTNGLRVATSGDPGSMTYFSVALAQSVTLFIELSPGGAGTGDADLYVKRNTLPTTADGGSDFSSVRPAGFIDSVTFSASPGTYYVAVRGFNRYDGWSLSASW